MKHPLYFDITIRTGNLEEILIESVNKKYLSQPWIVQLIDKHLEAHQLTTLEFKDAPMLKSLWCDGQEENIYHWNYCQARK